MTTIHVPYLDYETESVRTVLGDIYRTASAIENSAESLREHWNELPTHLTGTSVVATGYYGAMTNRTKSADELATMLRTLWKALDNYADDAKAPLENLTRLSEEVAAWQSRQPLTVMVAPDTPQQEIWAAQAGYPAGSGVCLMESPWTTWNNQKADLEAQIARWAREYERVADECAAALRRIKNPTAMAWWDHLGGSNPSRSSPIFSDGDNSQWLRSSDRFGFRDGRQSFVNTTHTFGPDGTHTVVDNGDPYREGEGEGDGSSDYFGYGIQGVNTNAEWMYGPQGEATHAYGNPDGVHGDLAASGNAGVWAEGSAGVNVKDGRLVAGASGEVGVGARGEASGSVEYGLLHASGKADAAVEAVASGRANASAGSEGLKANVGGELFAGAQGSLEADVGFSGVDAGVGVTGYAGIGVKADLDFAFSVDSVKMDVDVGAALGLGGAVKFSVDINPKKIVEDIGSLFGF